MAEPAQEQAQSPDVALATLRAQQFPVHIRPEWRKLAWKRVVEGKSVREAAFELGISYQSAYMWSKKELYQQYETWLCDRTLGADQLAGANPERFRTPEQVRTKLEEHAGEMQDRLLAILETSNDNKLVAGIAERWLDRAGFMPTKKVESTRRFVISDEQLSQLQHRAVEAELIDPSRALPVTVEEA